MSMVIKCSIISPALKPILRLRRDTKLSVTLFLRTVWNLMKDVFIKVNSAAMMELRL